MPELFRSRFPTGSALFYRLSLVLERMTFAAADAVISTNESYRRVAIERGRRDPARVYVVRNGPDLSRFVPLEPEPALKHGKRHLACYVGIMGFQDGLDYAIRAMAYLRDSLGRADVHAAFIGAGDAFEASVALAHQLGLDDAVDFTGFLPDAEIQRTFLDGRRAPGTRAEDAPERRLHHDQDHGVHGHGTPHRLVRPRRDPRVGRRRRRLRPRERRAGVRPADRELRYDPDRLIRMRRSGESASRASFRGRSPPGT